MIRVSTLALAFVVAFGAAAKLSEGPTVSSTIDDETIGSEEEAVKAAVVQFLTAIGNYDLDILPPMFSENASIGAVGFRDGKWNSTTYTHRRMIACTASAAERAHMPVPWVS